MNKNRNQKKVLLVVGSISSYRVPIYNLIAEVYDFTVAYSNKDEAKSECGFKRMKLKSYKLSSFILYPVSFYKLCKRYDAVIMLPDMHYLMHVSLPFLPHKYKLLTWSIGMRASYTHKYDLGRPQTFLDKVFYKINAKCDAMIFYMREVVDFYKPNGIETAKVFVAHNTVEVLPLQEKRQDVKNSILFVGTLYKEKNVDELVNAYIEVFKKCDTANVLDLVIVGDGAEFRRLQAMVNDSKLSKHIHLLGRIMDEEILRDLFSKAYICVSPNQAGLSVLKSMGYGVPFVTRRDAITGGEILNIIEGTNGILYDSYEDLVKIIKNVFEHGEKYVDMGEKALSYYRRNATPDKMAGGVVAALDYVFKDM